MILYFANRKMEILGHATTNLRKGFVITEDLKTEDIESGVAVFDCKIGYNGSNRKRLESMTQAGNYILRQNDGATEFYTIIDREIDTKKQQIYVYAEDAGLDLINEIAEPYEATEAHPAEWYVNKWIHDSGFEIGVNEIPDSSSRKLSWEGEATVTERLASIATQFGGYEISFSFAIKGMEITNKYVNIYAERGKSTEETLRLNRDIDRIIIKESVANLATALRCTGGMLEDGETYVTLQGYEYDDGDFYVDSDGILRSRNAVSKWSRYVWNKEPNTLDGYAGHIIRTYSYDTLVQATLCAHAVTELKSICDIEVNYEIDLKKLPENISIGDRVNIVDEEGKLYLSSRILKLETSVTEDTQTAIIGEHLIKEGGTSLKVEELAAQFAENAKSAAKAKAVADAAQTAADEAKAQADLALAESENAQTKADEAAAAASNATQSAAAANQAANNAQKAVENVEKNVDNLSAGVSNAQQAAQSAQAEAETAQTKAEEASQAAAQAKADAADAKADVEIAQSTAETAVTKAETAQSTAETAQSEANTAKATADAAKLDAAKANEDIADLGTELDTLSQTMKADYARKTDLTETEAHLQTQITQNASEIASNASKIVVIDETANNAAAQAEAAQKAAEEAQAQADTAIADAEAAQKAADDAATAAQAAQNEADTAKTAAATAQSAADKAQEDLATAQAELENVKSDVTATQEDLAAAEQAVANAQAKADAAQADAATAAQTAEKAQSVADTASKNATNAQNIANQAAQTASDAQAKADAAQGDATEAINTANAAQATATAAQEVANTAKTNATNAQAKADAAASEAATAQAAADSAGAKAAQAAADLETAKTNLANVTSRVDATEEEIEAAEAAVAKAQAAADGAAADAAAAQSTANTAKANAATAQTAANNAKTAAATAQKAADDAQDAADAAQAAVDALAVRVTKAETSITQNSEQIALRATKEEVATTLRGYYTKTETEAAISVKANEITSTVEETYQKTVSKGEQLVVNGNGLLGNNTNFSGWNYDGAVANNSPGSFTIAQGTKKTVITDEFFPVSTNNEYTFSFDAKTLYGLSRMYSMLVFYDADKKAIQAANHMYVPGSTTTLAQDLKAGDTVIYLADSSGWSTTTSNAGYMTIWNYKNSFGYTYPAETYSRNRVTLPKDGTKLNSANIDKSAHTITLATAYSGATIPAGTSVSQGRDGGNYKYVPCSNKLITAEWINYSGKYSGVDYSGTNISTMFPPGTAYAKVGFLWNYNTADDQTWVTNIVVTDTTAVSAAQKAADAAQADVNSLSTRVTQTESSITSQASQISSLGTRMSTVEQTADGLTVRVSTNETNIAANKTAAANAQSTADTAKTNAATAQTTANTANSTANSVKTDLANNYTKKTLPDTRNDNQTPEWYIKNYPKQIITEFKYASKIGLSGETYCTLTTTVPWTDSSGGYPKQTAKVAGKEYWRVGTSATAWGAWNDASATATNYLNFSSSGLVVGDMTASTLGKNVLIDSDSVDIRNGTTALASFGADKIQLGLKKSSAIIEMCGGMGTIGYGIPVCFNTNYLYVAGQNVALQGYSRASIFAWVSSAEWSKVETTFDTVTLRSNYSINTEDGTNVISGSEIYLNNTTIYGTADTIHFVSQSGTIFDGYVTLNSNLNFGSSGNAIKWAAKNSKNPYIGYATDQTDGTFVWSITGTNYASGLAIGGGSGNLLYKGVKVPTLSDTATTSTAGVMSASDKTKLNYTNVAYGTCSTAAATAAKVVTVTGNTKWTLAAGSIISVYFSATNTANNPTLNVNGTGAKNIYYGASQITTSNKGYAGTASRMMNFIYDGTQYRFIGWGYDGNTNTQIRVYRQDASGYNADYPLIASRTKAADLGTVGTESSYESVYGLISDTAANIPTINPYTGEMKVKALTASGDLTVGSASLGYSTGYVTGTWLRTTANIALSSAATTFAVLSSGWVYSRTAAQVLSDIGAAARDHTHPYFSVEGGTISGAVTLSSTTRVLGSLEAASGFTTTSIELQHATPYIDFHFNKSTADYTSRIIELASGVLTVTGSLNVKKGLIIENEANGGSLYGVNSSGTNLQILHLTSANNLSIGSGLYNASAGSTTVYAGTHVVLKNPRESIGLYTTTSTTYSAHLRPNTDGKCTLGVASYRWYAVYAANGTIQTSDRRQKENIMPIGLPQLMSISTDEEDVLTDLHSELFDRLQPVQYNMINGNGKTCFGLIAQDVVDAMHEVGYSENELELVHHDYWTDEESGETTDTYGLSYTNLIALLIHEVQKLKSEVAALKAAL